MPIHDRCCSRSAFGKAVIDFGGLFVGDPACDLAIAWTFFNDQSRAIFRSTLDLDKDTWDRGRAWVLWKSLIVIAGLTQTNAVESTSASQALKELLKE